MKIENNAADDSGQKNVFQGPAPLARRQLVRTAIAAPVVLSSLMSKPVLGGQHTGCTISGVLSGVTSHSPQAETCNTIGQSGAYWRADATIWPTVFKKGKLPSYNSSSGKCNISTSDTGTLFNGTSCGATSLSATFYRTVASSKCSVGPTGTEGATLLEVLCASDSAPNGRLGRATVISLLNAYKLSTAYPVTPAIIAQMFNNASKGQNYYINGGSAYFTPSQVLQYLESLYPASSW